MVGKLKNKIYHIGMKYFLYIFIFFFIALIPAQTFAYDLLVEPDITIDENYISDENIYMAGIKTIFNATFEKDVVSVAWNQWIRGSIFGNVMLVGNDITLDGEMFDDVWIIGNSVHITGITNKDLVIVANSIYIDDKAIINGDALILGNTVNLNGKYLGENHITANKINIEGEIVGPTTFTAQKLYIESGSKIVSEISYFSPQRAVVESNVEIQKSLNFNQIESIKQNDFVKRIFFSFVSFWAIIKLIATLFVLFVLIQLFKPFTQSIVSIVEEKKASVVASGIITFIFVPILSIILFGSLVLIPVSIIITLVFVICIILLPSLSAIIAGSLYQKYILKNEKIIVDFNISALALIMFTFVNFIPYLGKITIYSFYCAALGSLAIYLFRTVRRKKIKL